MMNLFPGDHPPVTLSVGFKYTDTESS